ncbi:MAG: hypothetical protein QOI10_206 [Solirubrobacterales bacterium]|jgi:hypothetical protein|nr:hypothetical protein [Solirubrobacterales bacterium]
MTLRARRPLFAIALAGLLAGCGSSSDSGGTSPGPPEPSRIVNARVYQGGKWTAPGETPETVGATLAKLKPTYVGSLLRFQLGEAVTAKEISDWKTIVAAVRAASPDAKFSVELNALEYTSADQLTAMMDKVRSAVDNDGWLFDFYTPAAKLRPEVMDAAITNAHENGEFLGGNAFGLAKHPVIPAGTDYIAVQDTDFHIDLDDVRDLAKRTTVFFHMGNNPALPKSDGCEFITGFDNAKRTAYLRERAGQQAQFHFHLGYPAFFPECAIKNGVQLHRVFVYNAVKDPPMIDTIGSLLDRFDGS